MKAERDRIAGGDPPSDDPYIFTLCPQQAFDMSVEPLTPLLDGASIVCGRGGNPGDLCVFSGGETQVLIEDSTVPDYDIGAVSIIGVTYNGFSNAAVGGSASDTTRVTLFDNRFSVSY